MILMGPFQVKIFSESLNFYVGKIIDVFFFYIKENTYDWCDLSSSFLIYSYKNNDSFGN